VLNHRLEGREMINKDGMKRTVRMRSSRQEKLCGREGGRAGGLEVRWHRQAGPGNPKTYPVTMLAPLMAVLKQMGELVLAHVLMICSPFPRVIT
jgi:hypothetical protein